MPEAPRGFHFPPFVMEPEDLEEVALKIEKNIETGNEEIFRPVPTGFHTVDEQTGGGLHSGDLNIIGGVQNIGKTALVLQWAHEIAASGALAIIVCYEHSTTTLWERLLCQSSFLVSGGEHISTDSLRTAYIEAIRGRNTAASRVDGGGRHALDDILGSLPDGVKAWADLSGKMRNIWLATGDGLNTDLEAIGKYIDLAAGSYDRRRIVLFVDYVQRVPVIDASRALEAKERTERVLAGLKGLAMRKTAEGMVLAVVAVGASDDEGLRQGRVHLENLWGNAIMQYEPDIAIIGNRDGWGEDGTPIVRWGLEKNRRGVSNLEFRHKYHGPAYWFEPKGALVERENSWQPERDEIREAIR
ncbi:MAG: DnaB-like helicase C-terminal domain-containing protein [Anaerolineales bacterium]|nr:DnaB-like helicase C-terminal domain-containing protein [Anaerolineales bacterium]